MKGVPAKVKVFIIMIFLNRVSTLRALGSLGLKSHTNLPVYIVTAQVSCGATSKDQLWWDLLQPDISSDTAFHASYIMITTRGRCGASDIDTFRVEGWKWNINLKKKA